MKKYYILSLVHSKGQSHFVWWRENNQGYTTDLNQAGIYTQEQIDEEPWYYNDGEHTKAIPVEVIEDIRVMRVVPRESDTLYTLLHEVS